MPTLTADQILSAIAPQFDSDPGRSVVLQLSTTRTPTGVYPEDEIRNNAIALLAAHMLTIAKQASSNASGPIVSRTVGPLHQSFGVPWGAMGPMTDLGTTSYGRELQELRNSYIVKPMTRHGDTLPIDDSSEVG